MIRAASSSPSGLPRPASIKDGGALFEELLEVLGLNVHQGLAITGATRPDLSPSAMTGHTP